jgi:putative transcriptional regulator
MELTDDEIEAAALADPDARPSTEEELKRMRRVPLAKHARWRAGMSQHRFAEAYEIAIGTLRDWEQGRSEPDQTARAYLKVIAADPAGTLRALAATRAKPAA